MRRATTGTFDISVDGGSATTIGGSGADALQSATISAGSLGSHTLHMGNVAGGIAVIIGVSNRWHWRNLCLKRRYAVRRNVKLGDNVG